VTLRYLLYPQLASFDPSERDEALRLARRAPFDVVELVGLAFGIILTVSLTRYGAGEWALLERALAFLANFLLAVPLLALLVGPFLVRRVRRALASELARRSMAPAR
jgi:hypothetical protein